MLRSEFRVCAYVSYFCIALLISNFSIVSAQNCSPIVTISTPDAKLNCTGACPNLTSIVTNILKEDAAYQWYNNSVQISGAIGSNFTACYPGTYNLSVLNTSGSCSGTSNSLVISPRVYPVVTISTPDLMLNCTGPCPILNSTVSDGIGPFAYQWYNNSVLIPGATSSNFTACYPGTYSLDVTNTTSNCTNSSNLLAIKLAVPLVIISTPDNRLRCTNSCPVISSTIIDGPGPFTYQWYNNSVLISGAMGTNLTACYPGTYSLNVTNSTSNCTNSSNLLVIKPRIYPVVTISTPDTKLNCTSICPILNSTVTDGTGPFAYQWYNDSVLISGATDANFTACYPGTYSLNVTNLTSNCSNSSNLLVINSRVYPVVTVFTADSLLNCTICPILSSTVTDGTGPFAYQWYNDSVLIPGATSYKFIACYPGNYSLNVTNITSNCSNSSNSQIIRPQVYPIVTISTPDTMLNCTGTCPVLNSTMTNGIGPFAYQWYNDSVLIPGATSFDFTACYPGTYSLNVTNSTINCTNSSKPLLISARGYPLVTISTPDTQLNCTACPILYSTVSDGTGPFAYQWYNDSVLIAGATASTFVACSSGTYNLSVTNTTSNCSSVSNPLVIVDTCRRMTLNKSDSTGGHLVGEGQTITYTYEVTNTGLVNLTDVTVKDDRVSNIVGPIDPNNDNKLNPGETWIFTGTYEVKFSDLAGDIVNTAEAEAEDPNGRLIVSNVAQDRVSPRPSMEGPVQFEQFCEAKKVSGEGVIDSGTSIVDKKLGLEYHNTMAGEGDLELDQEQAYSQNADKLKRNISSVNGGDQANLNLFERSKMTYSGDTPLTGGKYLHSKEFYGGIGADIQEMFSVNQMEKEQTAFFSTIPEEVQEKKGSSAFIGQLKAAGRNTSKVADIMANNSAYLVGLETKNTFNGTWGTDATWHRIFYKDVKSHQMFTGKFEADKIIKFHESPVPEKEKAACEGIDC